MDLAQIYDTTLVDRDTKLDFRFLVVPARSMAHPNLGDLDPTLRLGLEPINLLFRPRDIVYIMSLVLVANEGRLHWTDFEKLLRKGPEGLEPDTFEAALDFAETIAFSQVLPFESSPLEATSFAALTASGAAAGGYAGLVAAGGTPFVIVTVPLGMVLGGAAAGVARALNEGLYDRLSELLREKHSDFDEDP